MKKIYADSGTVSSQRDKTLDWICGLMILQMIFWHLIGYSGANWMLPYANILSFYMPWFFFKSGMFHRFDNHVKEYKSKQFRRLIVPFLFFSIIDLVIILLGNLLFHPEYSVRYYLGFVWSMMKCGHFGNGPLWYLLSLWIIKVCLNYQFARKHIWVIFCGSVFIPIFMFYSDLNSWHFLSHTLLGVSFYILGIKMCKMQYRKDIMLLSIVVLTFCLILAQDFVHVQMYSNQLRSGLYALNIPYSLSCIVLIDNLIKITPPIFVNSCLISAWITKIGKDSMSYLVSHDIVLYVVKTICFAIGLHQSSVIFILMVVSLIVVLPLCNKLFNKSSFKWMIGS